MNRDSDSFGRKSCCWHCYRLFYDSQSYSATNLNRIFCTEECYKNYCILNSVECCKKDCRKTFLRSDGVLREGKWYCEEKCAPSIEELLLSSRAADNQSKILMRAGEDEGLGEGMKETKEYKGKIKLNVKSKTSKDATNPDVEKIPSLTTTTNNTKKIGKNMSIDVLNAKGPGKFPSLEELEKKYLEAKNIH
eukprot:TRINITY_DN2350_c0_g2_i2.p1 TRINITY_DN2350_c0_g2~~TRINITY_DN2350_c0_g2_i2.p1  ORF type:complete len:192 (+),score=23.53 TRINITY_DN2350_c0_g2_i2:237-812(+)